MDRLKQRQAELRNGAERLNLQYQLGSYDNFKMLQAVAIMRRLEADLGANRYQNALRRKDILLDAMDNSRTLIGGEISVQHDTTPTGNRKVQREINDRHERLAPPGVGKPAQAVLSQARPGVRHGAARREEGRRRGTTDEHRATVFEVKHDL